MKNARGTLIPIGGGEDKEYEKHILCRFIVETGKKNPKICIITIATDQPKEMANEYKKAFRNIDAKKISVIHYELRPHADKKENIKKINECDAVLLCGGDQLKFSSLLGGTILLEIIKKRYNEEAKFVVAGTSAGAAAMSDTMIIAGSPKDALVKGELELTNGLDFIKNIFIDTHFTERGRFGRIFQTVTYNPGVLGIGIGEDTGAVIKNNKLEVIGSGMVMIADGTSIKFTDLTKVKNGEPITVEGIYVHVVGPKNIFLLDEKKVVQ